MSDFDWLRHAPASEVIEFARQQQASIHRARDVANQQLVAKRAAEAENARLKANNAELKRRIRLARHWLFSAGGNREARRMLDLRRPLRRKT